MAPAAWQAVSCKAFSGTSAEIIQSLMPVLTIDARASLPASGMSFFLFYFFWGGRKLTCPSMPIISAIRKTDKVNHRRVSGLMRGLELP